MQIAFPNQNHNNSKQSRPYPLNIQIVRRFLKKIIFFREFLEDSVFLQ